MTTVQFHDLNFRNVIEEMLESGLKQIRHLELNSVIFNEFSNSSDLDNIQEAGRALDLHVGSPDGRTEGRLFIKSMPSVNRGPCSRSMGHSALHKGALLRSGARRRVDYYSRERERFESESAECDDSRTRAPRVSIIGDAGQTRRARSHQRRTVRCVSQ